MPTPPPRLPVHARLRWRRGLRPPPRRTRPSWGQLARRLPVTFLVAGITLVFFALQYALGGTTDPSAQLRLGALRPDRVLEHGEWYRLVLPVLLHHGPIHLVLNGVAYLQLMLLTEHLYGSARALAFYLICGVTGTLSTTLFAPDWISGSVGASGAIMGLAGLLLGASWYGREPWRSRLRALFGRRLYLGVLLTFAIGIGLNLLVPIVDNWGHAGGFLGGMALAVLFRDPDRQTDLLARSLATVGVAAWLGSTVGMITTGGELLDDLPRDRAELMNRRAARHDDGLRAAILLAELVRAYHEADLAPRGQEILQERLQAAQNADTLRYLVGQLYGQPRFEAELELALDRWLQLAPDTPEALNALAWHLVTREAKPLDPAEAERLAARALALLPADEPTQRAAFLDTRAEALYQLGRAEEALPLQEEAVGLGTRHRMAELPEMRERLERIRARANRHKPRYHETR